MRTSILNSILLGIVDFLEYRGHMVKYRGHMIYMASRIVDILLSVELALELAHHTKSVM